MPTVIITSRNKKHKTIHRREENKTTALQLLELLIKYKEYFKYSLCHLLKTLNEKSIITHDERIDYKVFIYENMPTGKFACWFGLGDYNSRIKHLENLIKQGK